MMDPLAKRAKWLALRDKPKQKPGPKKRVKPRRKGSITQAEKSIIGEIINDAPYKGLRDEQVKALAIVLDRQPSAVQSLVATAREKFQANAEKYVDIHKAAVDLALANDDPDVARKGAEWAIEHMSARHADGKVERIIEQTAAQDTQPKIMIGINLGGLGQLPSGARV